jgi:copper chaperone CopZ
MTMFKILALAPALVLVLAVGAPMAASAQPTRTQAPQATIVADAVASVNGLVCDFCAQSIEKSLRRRPEVNDVRVDLTAKLISIDFKPNANLDDETIRRIITNAGFTVTDLRRPAATP